MSLFSSSLRSSLRKTFAVRSLATATAQKIPATLHLKSGQSFNGTSFGSTKSIWGETVFSTSITSCESFLPFSGSDPCKRQRRPNLDDLGDPSPPSCPFCKSSDPDSTNHPFFPCHSSSLIADTESMTDPSYRGQILVFTSPLIGNYGVPSNEPTAEFPGIPQMESGGVQCAGVIVTDVALKHSHYLAVESLHEWCDRHGVPGVSGIDTRAVTTLLRDQGTTLGRIAVGEEEIAKGAPADSEYWDPSGENLIAQVSTKEPYVLNPDGDVHVAVMDYGTKTNILRSLMKRNAKVTVLPWDYDFHSVKDQVRRSVHFLSSVGVVERRRPKTSFSRLCLERTRQLTSLCVCPP